MGYYYGVVKTTELKWVCAASLELLTLCVLIWELVTRMCSLVKLY